MPTKSITIDMEAYRRLSRVRRRNESFSRVIKRTVPLPLDLSAYLERLDATPMGGEAVAAIARHESRRHARAERAR